MVKMKIMVSVGSTDARLMELAHQYLQLSDESGASLIHGIDWDPDFDVESEVYSIFAWVDGIEGMSMVYVELATALNAAEMKMQEAKQ